VDGDEAGDAAALGEDFAHTMTGSLGRGEAYVDVLGRDDGLEVNIEAVSEEQKRAGFQVWSYFFRIQFRLGLIGSEDHDDVSPLGGLGGGGDFEAGLLGLGAGFGG
jgi:hypothetical protein